MDGHHIHAVHGLRAPAAVLTAENLPCLMAAYAVQQMARDLIHYFDDEAWNEALLLWRSLTCATPRHGSLRADLNRFANAVAAVVPAQELPEDWSRACFQNDDAGHHRLLVPLTLAGIDVVGRTITREGIKAVPDHTPEGQQRFDAVAHALSVLAEYRKDVASLNIAPKLCERVIAAISATGMVLILEGLSGEPPASPSAFGAGNPPPIAPGAVAEVAA